MAIEPGYFYPGLFDVAYKETFKTYADQRAPSKPGKLSMSLVALQRASLYAIQARITATVGVMRTRYKAPLDGMIETDRELWQDLQLNLHRFCEAVRDFEYMQGHSESSSVNDPFVITSTLELERRLLEDEGFLPNAQGIKGVLPLPPDHFKPQLGWMPRAVGTVASAKRLAATQKRRERSRRL